MLRRYATFLCIALLTIAEDAMAATMSPYYLADLGPVAPVASSGAYAVNSVGGHAMPVGQTGTGLTATPVSWTVSGGVATATTLGGGTLSGLGAAGVDSNGNIIVGKSPPTTGTRSYYLPTGGSPASLEPVGTGGSNASLALGMSDAGLVVGQSSSTTTGSYMQATAWSNSAGVWTPANMGGLAADALSSALAVNASGVAAGYSYSGTNMTDPKQAVTWTRSGSTWSIHDLNPTHSSLAGSSGAYAINGNGDVAGFGRWKGASYPDCCATLFRHDGTIVNLGNLGNQSPSGYAMAINDAGTLVGKDMNPAGAWHAFISDGTAGSMRDLNDVVLVPALGTWVLQYANGIDNRGDIVGCGVPAESAGMHGWLLQPALSGDANMDRVVDMTDLAKVLTNYDKSGMNWAQGDFSGDALVDVADLAKVLTNYDKALGAKDTGGVRVVPEPGSLALMAGWLVCAWRKKGGLA